MAQPVEFPAGAQAHPEGREHQHHVEDKGQRLEPDQRLHADPDQWDHDHRHRRSEEHTSELQSLMRISYADFCLKNKTYDSANKTTSTSDPAIHTDNAQIW